MESAEQDAPEVISSVTTEIAPAEVAKGVVESEVSPASHEPPDNLSPDKTETPFDKFAKTFDEVAGKPKDEAEPEPEAKEAAPKTDEPEAEVKAEETDPKALSQESKVKVPNEQRPEWQKLTTIGDKLGKQAGKEVREVLRGIYSQEAKYVQQIEQLKPAADAVAEMKKSVGGSEQGFANMRQLINNYDSDPAAAVDGLKMLLDDAMKRAGMVIQSPELLTEAEELDNQLKDQVIDQTAYDKRKAELLQLEKAKVTTSQVEARQKAEREAKQRTQSEAATRKAEVEINTAETSWTASKLKGDPDFIAVQGIHDAFAKQNALDFWNEQKRFPNAKEAVEILEKSLKMAKAEAMKFRPKPEARKPVVGNSNGSSAQHRQQPVTEAEKFDAIFDEAVARNKR